LTNEFPVFVKNPKFGKFEKIFPKYAEKIQCLGKISKS
jgi:hypothetical protein